MENDEDVKGINWLIGIPVVLWIGITVLGILKVLLSGSFEPGIKGVTVAIINTFNSCTFSTFISVIACMLYQYLTTDKEKRAEVSGLVMGRVPAIIILTIVYGGAAIFDAAINHLIMTIIFLVINIIYVICFFKLFLVKKQK